MTYSHIPSFETRAIHAGDECIPGANIDVIPVHQEILDGFENAEHDANHFNMQSVNDPYARDSNHNRSILEERISALEEGTAAVAISSIYAAQFLIFQILMDPGDEFIVAQQLHDRFSHNFHKCDWNIKWANIDDISTFENAITPKTKGIFIETITHLGNQISDIEAFSKLARLAGVPLIVDNTIASPYLCRPIQHGANIIVHSTNEFLGSHSNSSGSIIIDAGSFNWSRESRYPNLCKPCLSHNNVVLCEKFGNFAFAVACRILGCQDFGFALPPLDTFLLLNGTETLHLRMQRHCDNALSTAQFLSHHPKVAWVDYAGLTSNRYHNLALKYCPNGAGAILTFGLNGDHNTLANLMSNLQMISCRANVSSAHSKISLASSTNHQRSTEDRRHLTTNTAKDMIRFSVGLEGADDIITDLDRALYSW